MVRLYKQKLEKILALFIFIFAECAFGLDCNLPYGDAPCMCCAKTWGDFNAPPPEIALIVFYNIERTDCEPGWIMLPPPNDRVFVLLRNDITGDTCEWSYNLNDVGGEDGVDSDVWVIRLDLTAYWSFNVYLANKVDDPPCDMVYFYRRGHTDCRTIYINELDNWNCDGAFFYFWAGGTAKIFWPNSPDFGDFNGDGIVNFNDYVILLAGNDEIPIEYISYFGRNWLREF